MAGRSLDEIVMDLERGEPLILGEEACVERLFAMLPPRPPAEGRAQRNQLIRATVAQYAPVEARSILARVTWFEDKMAVFVGGADWRANRAALVCPIKGNTLRAALWLIAKHGPVPQGRRLHDIIAGVAD